MGILGDDQSCEYLPDLAVWTPNRIGRLSDNSARI